jgi:hypothetical protein
MRLGYVKRRMFGIAEATSPAPKVTNILVYYGKHPGNPRAPECYWVIEGDRVLAFLTVRDTFFGLLNGYGRLPEASKIRVNVKSRAAVARGSSDVATCYLTALTQNTLERWCR